MFMKKFIATKIRCYLTEAYDNSNKIVDFDSFPDSVRKTLEDEYGDFQYNFNWNDKQDEYGDDREGFSEWLRNNKSEEFLKNIDKIIRMTTQDMILLKRKKMANAKLEAFEKLIIPAIGNDKLLYKLNKFQEEVLMNPYKSSSLEELNHYMKGAENIVDADGSINPLKLEISDMFDDVGINIWKFEKFIEENPDYQGVYDDWKKLFDKDIELTLKELHAYRSSTSISEIRELRNYLINFKRKINA